MKERIFTEGNLTCDPRDACYETRQCNRALFFNLGTSETFQTTIK